MLRGELAGWRLLLGGGRRSLGLPQLPDQHSNRLFDAGIRDRGHDLPAINWRLAQHPLSQFRVHELA